MAGDAEHLNEQSHLLPQDNRRLSRLQQGVDAESIISSHISKDEQILGETALGERLPYNDYTTIDWLHDLVSLTTNRILSKTDDHVV